MAVLLFLPQPSSCSKSLYYSGRATVKPRNIIVNATNEKGFKFHVQPQTAAYSCHYFTPTGYNYETRYSERVDCGARLGDMVQVTMSCDIEKRIMISEISVYEAKTEGGYCQL